jgi:hypothetical protein
MTGGADAPMSPPFLNLQRRTPEPNITASSGCERMPSAQLSPPKSLLLPPGE